MYIQNNNDYTLTPAQQQAVINAATTYGGIDEVVMGELFEDEDVDGLMYAPVEDVDGEFLFNLNMKTNETC